MGHSIRAYLNPEIVKDPLLLKKIGGHLSRGSLLVIPNAFRGDFAERIFRELDNFNHWRIYENYTSSQFHYRHHNSYEPELYPSVLKFCSSLFESKATKEFISQLARSDCRGKLQFGASWYMPGDHSTPHSDRSENRQVAFVWHLSKNWKPNWGGDFFWARGAQMIPPSFNTLMLFRTLRDGIHCVTEVTPVAQSKRLAVSGWWTGKPSVDRDQKKDSVLILDDLQGVYAVP